MFFNFQLIYKNFVNAAERKCRRKLYTHINPGKTFDSINNSFNENVFVLNEEKKNITIIIKMRWKNNNTKITFSYRLTEKPMRK